MSAMNAVARPPESVTDIDVHAHADRRWINQLFEMLGERYVLYYPKLSDQLGDAKTALFLGKVLSWTRLAVKNAPSLEGWVWQSAERISHDTGLSRAEQSTARKVLADADVLEERLAGMPARLHYRINLNSLATLLSRNRGHAASWSWQPEHLRELLGARPIAVHQRLVDTTGDTLSALYLSVLIGWTRAALLDGNATVPAQLRGKQLWFDVGIEALRARLQLSRKVQQRCRRRLLDRGVISETYTAGLSPRLLTAINLDAVGGLLSSVSKSGKAACEPNALQCELALPRSEAALKIGSQPNEIGSFKERDTTDCGNPAIKDVVIQHPVVSLSLKQDCADLENRTAPNLQTCFKDRGSTHTVLKEKELSNLHQPSSLPEGVATMRPAGRRRIEFEFDGLKALSPQELIEVDRLAQHAGDHGQSLIDELAFALTQSMSRPVRNPVAYLSALLRKVQSGTFVPAGALRIQVKRREAISRLAQDEMKRAEAAQFALPEMQARSRSVALEALSAAKERYARKVAQR